MENGVFDTTQRCGFTGKRKTQVQIQALETFFSEEKYPNRNSMQEFSMTIGLTCDQVRLWFKNKRRKKDKGKSVDSSSSAPCGTRSEIMSKGECSSNRAFKNLSSRGNVNASKHVSELTLVEKKSLVSNVDSRLTSAGGKRRVQVQKPAAFKKLLHGKSLIPPQVIVSHEYILKKVFRKDGPPLGIEFDHIPANAFGQLTGHIRCPQAHQGSKIVSKKKSKPQESSSMPAGYGIGKGLMTIWHAKNPDSRSFPTVTNSIYRNAMSLTCNAEKSSSRQSNKSRCQDLKRKKQCSKFKKKQMPPKKIKVVFANSNHQDDSYSTACKFAVDGLKDTHWLDSLELMDDEELEMNGLQADQNIPRCSTHVTSNGRNGCPLCKDMLSRFPPKSVKMKHPFCTRPWATSLVILKKLFKVFQFVYTHAVRIEICPFTLDEFAQAFHKKDSLLLGKIHVALLKLLLSNVEREISGLLSRASKDCRYLEFLHSVKQHEFDVSFWIWSLNSMTWVEILRQVLIAAGFGPKHCHNRSRVVNKEVNLMVKYGLRPRTLKGELFTILSEQGNKGLKISELSGASQIASLSLPNKSDEVEDLICSTLSSDITLFEKIGSSSFRLRSNVTTNDTSLYSSDSESDYSGSIDDDRESFSPSSLADEDESLKASHSALYVQSVIQFKSHHKNKLRNLTKFTEIDESFSGEAWVQGLMEGGYSDLSIEEKLDALVSLVDLTSSGFNLRKEYLQEPIRDVSSGPNSNVRYHGSGAKIKKLIASNTALPKSTFHVTDDIDETISRMESPGSSGSCAHPLESVHLGYDRRYNSYWLFLGPCNNKDPGHHRVYFESSEDGRWQMIDSKKDLSSLMSVIDPRGKREAQLLASLEKLEIFLFKEMGKPIGTGSTINLSRVSDSSDADVLSEKGSSPVSNVDNNSLFEEHTNGRNCMASTTSTTVELGKRCEEKKLKWEELQEFDKWIWNSFYRNLNAVNHCKRSYYESLIHCESCHDLYWRDEKHCKKCHTTFELDFDLEERYAIHVATCRDDEASAVFSNFRVLSSQLQVLKAAIHAIEITIPKEALVETWTESSHNLWGKRLRRTSSLSELLQVVANFVGAIKEEWLYERTSLICSSTIPDDVIVLFHSMPQTTSAVALWMLMLDSHIAPHLRS